MGKKKFLSEKSAGDAAIHMQGKLDLCVKNGP